MNFSTETHGDIAIFHLDGDVMGGPEATRVNEEINRMLDEGTLKVVIDLAGVTRMNSSGLGILINALNTYKKNGGDLKLANVAPVVQNLMTITKLNTLFDIHDSVELAIANF